MTQTRRLSWLPEDGERDDSRLAPGTLGFGKKRSIGKSLSPPMKTLSSFLKLAACMPASILTVKYTSLIGPRISSILPIWVLFER